MPKLQLLKQLVDLRYCIMCLVFNVPEYVIKEVNKMLFKFLWGSNKEK